MYPMPECMRSSRVSVSDSVSDSTGVAATGGAVAVAGRRRRRVPVELRGAEEELDGACGDDIGASVRCRLVGDCETSSLSALRLVDDDIMVMCVCDCNGQ